MQYPGNHCRKLKVYTKFRVPQEFEILERFKANCRKFVKIRFSKFWKIYSTMLSYGIPLLLQPSLLHWTYWQQMSPPMVSVWSGTLQEIKMEK